MDNYHYIIAGLPDLVPEFGTQQFSYETFSQQITGQLSKKDGRLVDWLEFGSVRENLSSHFYLAAARCKNPFISQYFPFDCKLRNAQVRFLAKKEGKDEKGYLVGDFDNEFDEYPRLVQIFDNPNVIEREQAMDKLRWAKISEISTFHYFDIDVILAFLAKGKIVQRWLDMDKVVGAKLFEQFVQEVRGTFTGINF